MLNDYILCSFIYLDLLMVGDEVMHVFFSKSLSAKRYLTNHCNALDPWNIS